MFVKGCGIIGPWWRFLLVREGLPGAEAREHILDEASVLYTSLRARIRRRLWRRAG